MANVKKWAVGSWVLFPNVISNSYSNFWTARKILFLSQPSMERQWCSTRAEFWRYKVFKVVQGVWMQTVTSNLDQKEWKNAINFNLKVDSNQGRLGIWYSTIKIQKNILQHPQNLCQSQIFYFEIAVFFQFYILYVSLTEMLCAWRYFFFILINQA